MMNKLEEEGRRLEEALQARDTRNMTRARIFAEIIDENLHAKIEKVEARLRKVEVTTPRSAYHSSLLCIHLDLLDEKIRKGTEGTLALSMRTIV